MDNIGQRYPLSPMQEGMLFHHLYAESPAVDMLQVLVNVHHPLEVGPLAAAWNWAVHRHESLRTAYFWEGLAEPSQAPCQDVSVELDFRDVSGLTSDRQCYEIKSYLSADRRRRFDLRMGRLLRLMLFLKAPTEYLLVATFHHICIDGRGVQVVLKDVFDRYDTLRAGRELELPRPRSYREYVDWVKQLDLSSAKKFWQQHLKGFATATPVLKDNSASESRAGGDTHRQQEISLDLALTSKLRDLMLREGLTMNTLVQGAWALLLSHYSGEEDVLFGATKSTRRTIPGANSIVGLMISTLPVRVRVGGEHTLLPWLRQLREQWISYREHDHTALTTIQQASSVPSGSPLFETLVAFENGNFGDALRALGGNWKKREIRVISVDTNYPLTLFAFAGERLHLQIGYKNSEFLDSTVVRMLGHLRTILESIGHDPHRRLADIPWLTPAELEDFATGNWSTAEYPPKCIHEFFEIQAERTPDTTAVVFEEQRISYAELDMRSNQLARYLRTLGVGAEVLVGICMERSPEMLVGILGILKAGGAYVPLDPAYPKDRLAFCLDDCRAPVLLADQRLIGMLPNKPAKVVCLDSEWKAIARESHDKLPASATPQNLAYLIYTSGSTGRPKGVAIEHRSTSTFIQWAQSVFPPQELSGVLFSTSVCFDLSIFEMFVPLSCGGSVILAQNALELPALSAADEVTLINTVPSAMAELLRICGIPSSVRVVNLAGEPLSRTLVRQIYAQTSVQRVYNLYGPTEDTTYSTFTLVPDDDSPVTIGKPITNTTTFVLDKYRHPVPVGLTGELYLGGDGLARGYFGRPELTDERFVPNSLFCTRGARLYRTGDLVRQLPNGELVFLGRIDHQVKLRGFRIELGEIEAVLSNDHLVRQSLVMVREDNPGNKQLVAYVVPSSTPAQPSEWLADLHRGLKAKLPDYMVPSLFVILEQFPLTPNGKIDRKALPAPVNAISIATRSYVEPRTQTEELVAAIWAEVLHAGQIGAQDQFFDFGHSLLATQVISRVRHAFKLEIPLRTLFDFPILAEFAEQIDEARRRQQDSPAPPITKVPRDRPLPLSFAQQRLWFVNQMESGNNVYNLPVALRLSGRLNQEALNKSINEIVRRHEVLRTTFVELDDQAVQLIAPELLIEMRLQDLSILQLDSREQEARVRAQEEYLRPFDITRGPLLRALLLRLDPQEHLLIITLHHIVSDGWSGAVLINELGALYAAFVDKKTSPLPELPLQYADYAVWQRNWLTDEVLNQQLAYWRKQLQGIPPLLKLPLDHPRPQAPSYRGALETFDFPAEFTQQLKDFSRREGVTFFMTLVSAFQVLLYRYSAQQQLVIGTDLANRTRIETEQLIGFFVNVLPLRADFTGDPVFRELLGQVRDVALGAYAHQDVPFDKVVEDLSPQRTLSYNPLVQVLFVMLNTPNAAPQVTGLDISPYEMELTRSKFDLALFIQERATGVSAAFLYSIDLFDAGTIRCAVGNYVTLLRSILANPQARISTLELMTEEEQHQHNLKKKQRQESKGKQLRLATRKPVEMPSDSESSAHSRKG